MAINRLQPSTNGNGKLHTLAANPADASANGKAPARAADAARVGVAADAPTPAAPAAATKPAKVSANGRDAKGRFAAGNSGGPGNPFARQVAELKRCFQEEATIDKIRGIAKKMIALAEEGNVPAAKLVLSYALGKPQESFNPDQIDIDEWQRFEETAPCFDKVPGIMNSPDAQLAVSVMREMRALSTKKIQALTLGALSLPREQYQKTRDLPPKQRDARFFKVGQKAQRDLDKYGYVRSIEKECAAARQRDPHSQAGDIAVAGPSANGGKRST